MKLFNILPTIAALTASAWAKTFFADWPLNGVTIGETYNLVWFSDAPETIIQISLVRLCDRIPNGDVCLWQVVDDLASQVGTNVPGGRMTWTVNEKLDPGEGYALFIISEPAHIHRYPVPGSPRPGQTEDLTNYFSIHAPFNATQVLERLRAQEL